MTNIRPKILFNGMEYTAQFHATRDITPNEELFFDYNFPQDFEWLRNYKTKKVQRKNAKKKNMIN